MLSAKEHPSLSWRTIEFDTAYIAFSLGIRGPQNTSKRFCHLKWWTYGNRESTKICNWVHCVAYRQRQSDTKKEDIATCLFGESQNKHLLDTLGPTQAMCTKSYAHWGRGWANSRDLSILQRNSDQTSSCGVAVLLMEMWDEGVSSSDVAAANLYINIIW